MEFLDKAVYANAMLIFVMFSAKCEEEHFPLIDLVAVPTQPHRFEVGQVCIWLPANYALPVAQTKDLLGELLWQAVPDFGLERYILAKEKIQNDQNHAVGGCHAAITQREFLNAKRRLHSPLELGFPVVGCVAGIIAKVMDKCPDLCPLVTAYFSLINDRELN